MHVIIFASILGLIGLLQFLAAFLPLPPSLNAWFWSGGRKMRALLSAVPEKHRERASRLVVGAVCVFASVSVLASRMS